MQGIATEDWDRVCWACGRGEGSRALGWVLDWALCAGAGVRERFFGLFDWLIF